MNHNQDHWCCLRLLYTDFCRQATDQFHHQRRIKHGGLFSSLEASEHLKTFTLALVAVFFYFDRFMCPKNKLQNFYPNKEIVFFGKSTLFLGNHSSLLLAWYIWGYHHLIWSKFFPQQRYGCIFVKGISPPIWVDDWVIQFHIC